MRTAADPAQVERRRPGRGADVDAHAGALELEVAGGGVDVKVGEGGRGGQAGEPEPAGEPPGPLAEHALTLAGLAGDARAQGDALSGTLEAMRRACDGPTLQAARDELLRNFGSDSFAMSLEEVIQGSRLPQVRYLLGGTFGAALQEAGLWPLRFMTVDHTEVTPGPAGGLYTLSLSLSAYSRDGQ